MYEVTQEVSLSLMFFAGAVLQGIILVGRKFQAIDILGIALAVSGSVVAAGLWWLRVDNNLSPEIFAIAASAIFIAVFSAMFRHKVLAEIDELVLIVYTCVFWYVHLTRTASIDFPDFIFLAPSVAVLLIGIFKVKLRFISRVLLYCWFMFMLVYTAIWYFRLGSLEFVINPLAVANTSYLEVLLAGMLAIYIGVYALYLLYFLPIQGKNQSYLHRRMEILEHAINIGLAYNPSQFHTLSIAFIICLVSGLLWLNWSVNFFSDSLLISLLLVIAPVLGHAVHKIFTKTQRGIAWP